MLNYKLLTVLAFILTAGIFYEEAFAAAGSAYTPTQTNAYASYNNGTNQVQIAWDFDLMTPGDKCVIKMDIDYQSRATIDYVPIAKISHYIPDYYSAISSSPTFIGSSGSYAEEVDCEDASFRIDLDTIMNDPLNIHGLDNLMIYLTFYATDDLTSYSLSDSNRIDEVFVVYSPNEVLVNGVLNVGNDQIQWACDQQIGSVLFIDPSGSSGTIIAHGNNGDNCDKYLYIENDEWVDIGMANSYPGLAQGVIAKEFHNPPLFSLLIKVVEDIIIHGGSDDDADSRPTFGVDHKRFTQLVDEGLVVNGQIIPVLNNFHTEMDIIELDVGVTQNFTSTVFAPHTLKTLEFVFGVPEIQQWHDREASIEIYTNYDADALGFKINEIDEDNPLIDATSLVYSTSKVKCNATDNTDACYRVSIEFSFLEAPSGKVLALQAIDNSRKTEITYFNDGLHITGESLNPPTVQQIISDIKYKGLQTVQRIDKENNIWMSMDKSEPVLLYIQNDHGTFIPIEYRITEPIRDEIKMNMDRTNSEFKHIITYEIKRATKVFDSSLFISEVKPSWSYVYPPQVDRMEELQESLKVEIERAQLEKVLSTKK